MTTILKDELRREILIDKRPFTLLLSGKGFKITEKGKRLGAELQWKDVVSGDAAIAAALQASVTAVAKKSRTQPVLNTKTFALRTPAKSAKTG